MGHEFAHFVTTPSRPGDGPPDWPKGADRRIVGIRCPMCGHTKSGPEYYNNGLGGERVQCSKCSWSGRVPL